MFLQGADQARAPHPTAPPHCATPLRHPTAPPHRAPPRCACTIRAHFQPLALPSTVGPAPSRRPVCKQSVCKRQSCRQVSLTCLLLLIRSIQALVLKYAALAAKWLEPPKDALDTLASCPFFDSCTLSTACISPVSRSVANPVSLCLLRCRPAYMLAAQPRSHGPRIRDRALADACACSDWGSKRTGAQGGGPLGPQRIRADGLHAVRSSDQAHRGGLSFPPTPNPLLER